MNELIEKTYQNFEETNYKAALKTGFFDYQSARDFYREALDMPMHKELVMKYIETQCLLMAPITPHFSEFIWREVLGHHSTVQDAKFPRATKPVDQSILGSLNYCRHILRCVRELEGEKLKKKQRKTKKETNGTIDCGIDISKPVKLTIYIAKCFPEWQTQYVELTSELIKEDKLGDIAYIKSRIGEDMKRAMPFITHLIHRLEKEPKEVVLNRQLNFDEIETVKNVWQNLKRAPQFAKVETMTVIAFKPGERVGLDVITGEEREIRVTGKVIEAVVPGQPGMVMENM